MSENVAESFELGPIRPPSEAYSLLIRVTRNCPWNRCRFCGTYKGERFELRPVEDVKRDIVTARDILGKLKALSGRPGHAGDLKKVAGAVFNDAPNDAYRNVALWAYAGGKSAFLQDANTLIMRTNDLVDIIKYLKETLPTIERVTSYGRSKTAARKKLEELVALREAGLSRLHMGLESGCDHVLQFVDKGVTAAEQIVGGQRVVASGISLCEYVILGLGGKKMWREHALETARALNEINPDFIRVRTLSVNGRMPMHADVENGGFVRETDEEIIEEERLLIEHLDCRSNFVSDHITNLLQEVEGRLPEDRQKMLAVIARFQSLAPEARAHFRIGRRLGIYERLDDLDDLQCREAVEQAVIRLGWDGGEPGEQATYRLMERFI